MVKKNKYFVNIYIDNIKNIFKIFSENNIA